MTARPATLNQPLRVAILGNQGAPILQLSHDLVVRIQSRDLRVVMGISKEGSTEADISIDDTAPLMAALLGGVQYNASRQLELALAHRKTYDLTLVCGWEPASTGSSAIHAETTACEATDKRLREALSTNQIAFAVLYGSLSNRVDTAFRIILSKTQCIPQKNAMDERRVWQPSCEKCSDPACEQRIFTRLLASRQ